MAISAVSSAGFYPAQQQYQPTKNKKQDYYRTDSFKIMGAGVGTALGALTAFAETKSPALIFLNAIAGASIGALSGVLADFTINEIVENTVHSIKKKKQ